MGIRVKAKQLGYYGHKRRREGDEFEIESEKEYSKRWMKRADGSEDEEQEEEQGSEPSPAEGSAQKKKTLKTQSGGPGVGAKPVI